MKKSKTCFFEKIGTIKLATKVHLLSNHIRMGGKNTLSAAMALTAAMAVTSPVMAQKPNTTAQQKTISCETKQACQKLTESLQARIDEINAQSNLSKDAKRLRYNLRKQLIALEKSETEKNTNLIATENQKQEKQQKTIAAEKSETTQKIDKKAEKSRLIDAKLKAQDAQLAGLRGALLEN